MQNTPCAMRTLRLLTLVSSMTKGHVVMTDTFDPAITALQSDLAKLEDQVREVKSAINLLCKHAGRPEMYRVADTDNSSATITSIQADTFYGKTIGAAAREYLEMRRSANMGPAATREVFDALTEGGFQFNSKNKNNAMISLGQTMRKSSKIFHKLPNGKYGLLTWYPNAKEGKSSDDDEKDSATSTKPVAENSKSSGAPLNDQEEGASEPQEKGE